MITNIKFKNYLLISYFLFLLLLILSIFGLYDFGKSFYEYKLSVNYVFLFFILFFALFSFIAFEVLYFYYKFKFFDFFKYFKSFTPETLYFSSFVIFVFTWGSFANYFYVHYLTLPNFFFISSVIYLILSLFVLIFSYKMDLIVKSFLFLGFTFFCMSGLIDIYVFYNAILLGELIFISNFVYLFKVLGFFSLLFSYVVVLEK